MSSISPTSSGGSSPKPVSAKDLVAVYDSGKGTYMITVKDPNKQLGKNDLKGEAGLKILLNGQESFDIDPEHAKEIYAALGKSATWQEGFKASVSSQTQKKTKEITADDLVAIKNRKGNYVITIRDKDTKLGKDDIAGEEGIAKLFDRWRNAELEIQLDDKYNKKIAHALLASETIDTDLRDSPRAVETTRQNLLKAARRWVYGEGPPSP